MTLLIDNDISSKLLTMSDCLRVLDRAFKEEGRGEAAGRKKSSIHVPTSHPEEWYRYASMEGASRELQVACVRIKSDVVSWPIVDGRRRGTKWTGRPGKYGGLILLYSTETGELLAILNDGWLQHMRVGATFAIGSKYQAREDAAVVGLLGTGGMARSYIEALVQLCPIRRLQVYSPNQKHLKTYADEMRDKLGIEVQAVNSPKAAMADVDIVASMTDSANPTLVPDMLRPGIHATTVIDSEMHPDVYPRLNRMVVYRDGISDNHYTTPEEWRPLKNGGTFAETAKLESVIPQDHFHHLTDVMLGRAVGRRDADEITYFASEGTGIQFAAVAHETYRRAREQGLGRELPSEWFLQDIRT